MPNLLLCMTPKVGLNTWKKIGSLNRELRPYMEYVRKGWNVKILAFDKGAVPKLPEGIEAVRFPHYQLLLFLPWLHNKLGKWADVIKTNQSAHAYFYVRAARHWKKPILLRCGYVLGEFFETTRGLTPGVKFYQWLESYAFQKATHCQVPTKGLSGWVQKKFNVSENKILVLPNYVDTEIFKPIERIRKKDKSVISIGRLVTIKKFDLLINACAEIPGCELTIIGEGPEKAILQQLAKEHGLRLTLPGNIPNESLPKIIQEHSVFAITSEREGHPKALIEAMSCKMPCIGTDAIGIRDVIDHGENGWLIDPTPNALREGIATLFEGSELRNRLSENARGAVLKKYNFEDCFSREYDLVQSIIGKREFAA